MFLQPPDLSNGHVGRVIVVYSDGFYPQEGLSNEYVCPLICQKVPVEKVPLESTLLGLFNFEVEIAEWPELDRFWRFWTVIALELLGRRFESSYSSMVVIFLIHETMIQTI